VLRRGRGRVWGWDSDDPDYTAVGEMTILELLRLTPVRAPVLVGADSTATSVRCPRSS
jgi:hypothetical protein